MWFPSLNDATEWHHDILSHTGIFLWWTRSLQEFWLHSTLPTDFLLQMIALNVNNNCSGAGEGRGKCCTAPARASDRAVSHLTSSGGVRVIHQHAHAKRRLHNEATLLHALQGEAAGSATALGLSQRRLLTLSPGWVSVSSHYLLSVHASVSAG